MAEKNNVRRLKTMLHSSTAPVQPASDAGTPAAEDTPPVVETLVRGKPYRTGFDDAEIVLLPEGAQLRESLQDIARRYIGARRRSGEALLEAARWLDEARHEAQHGEWQLFLDATGTSADAAERLLNIHTLAMQNPQFADSVRTNWLGQSAAALLARPSTPPEVVAEVLAEPEAPSVGTVQRRVRQARERQPDVGQNPQIADFAPITAGEAGGAPLDSQEQHVRGLRLLHQVADVLAMLAEMTDALPDTTEVQQTLERAEHALHTLRHSLHGQR